MRLPRTLVDLPLDAGARLTLPPAPSHHLVRVLRLRVGDPLVLFNGNGRDFPGTILRAAEAGVEVRIGAPTEVEPPPPLEIHLGIGISKGERMDLVVQKAVELGVASISPLFTERSLVRLEGERMARRLQHWQGVLVAACEQCGRRRLPTLATGSLLGQWLSQPHPFPLLLHHEGAQGLPALGTPGGGLTLLVGPEGGLDPRERAQAQRAGFTLVRLGPRILRTETAPLAALAAIQTLWGDFRA